MLYEIATENATAEKGRCGMSGMSEIVLFGCEYKKSLVKVNLQGFAIIRFDILRYGRDSNPRPPA